MPKQVAERQRVNPDTGEWERMGVTEDGDTIAKDDKSAAAVAQEFLEEFGEELRSQGLLTPATFEYLQERMDVLYPEGYTKNELADVVKRGIAIGDITKPAPVVEGPSEDEQRITEYIEWSRTATASQRQQRRSEDRGYAEWHQRESLMQRQKGSDLTPSDVSAITVDHNLVAFADAFRRAPRESLRPKNGWVTVPNFLNGAPMTTDQFNQWIEAASAARLL